jgi:ADP-ribosylglycohydrolase
MPLYPGITDLDEKVKLLQAWAELKYEEGANVASVYRRINRALDREIRNARKLGINKNLRKKEPDSLNAIKALRPRGPRVMWKSLDEKIYQKKLQGAFLARCIGCTMGSIVEFWEVREMETWAQAIGDKFPPVHFWSKARDPERLKYNMSKFRAYTRSEMDGIPVDDDLVYTLLGLLIVEDYGPDFTVADVGKAWKKYLPHACTAEKVALANLKKGVRASRAAERDNPYVQWIGADIRSDPFGYMAPGLPEKAAEMAYHEAYISHRRNGIYGEMFFSAAIAAAFAVKNPIDAIKIGLTEIPRDCALAKDVKWALKKMKTIRNYKQARAAVDNKFQGMSGVHTNLNAALTIFGLNIGKLNVVKVLGETVAMGQDNDCTAATAGSLVGAVAGRSKIPRYLTARFNNKIRSYIKKKPVFRLDSLYKRFGRMAKQVFKTI